MRTRSRDKTDRGFTLLEILVAVGAVALIAAGLAAIFSAVGKTVSGGRRVSENTRIASLVEQQMRRDFESMTREGFLVIRQGYSTRDTNNAGNIDQNVVALSEIDTERGIVRRVRRVDEILFFARGQYTSAAEPIRAGEVVTSDRARIYYGHGQRRSERDAIYAPPSVDDEMMEQGDNKSILGRFDSENELASRWTLLRHVALLKDPTSTSMTARAVPGGPVFPSRLAPYIDKDNQISMQPAASTPFRQVNRVVPRQTPANPNPETFCYWSVFATERARNSGLRPSLASGLVDIITMSLAEIQDHVMTSRASPKVILSFPAYVSQGPSQSFQPGVASMIRMQQWMEDALPTQSDPYRVVSPVEPVSGTRMRYQEGPTLTDSYDGYDDLVGTRTLGANRVAEAIYLRRDQLMLQSPVFLARCSEFQVEWTFGEVGADDSMIWYGGNEDTDRDGRREITMYTPLANEAGAFRPFEQMTSLPNTVRQHAVGRNLIYGDGVGIDADTRERVLTAHFGYADPTFTPASESDAIQTVPWAWPKAIRVTLRIADQRDPSLEESFQFVFQTPGTPRP